MAFFLLVLTDQSGLVRLWGSASLFVFASSVSLSPWPKTVPLPFPLSCTVPEPRWITGIPTALGRDNGGDPGNQTARNILVRQQMLPARTKMDRQIVKVRLDNPSAAFPSLEENALCSGKGLLFLLASIFTLFAVTCPDIPVLKDLPPFDEKSMGVIFAPGDLP